MNKYKHKHFNSLSKHLLKVVFAFYFSITIVMTLAHFVIEYYHTQDTIKDELQLISQTFMSATQQALWNLDTAQISSICDGALKLPSVLAVDIYDKNVKQQLYYVEEKTFDKNSKGIFSYSHDVFHTTQQNKQIYIGTVTYFSDYNVVLDRVKVGFYIIFFNSLIKSLILTILFIVAFNRYLTKPLDVITKSIQKVDLHNLDNHQYVDVDKSKNDELTFLGNAFNKMLFNLNEKLKVLKETQNHILESEKMVALGGMVAGVSHEINTPVGMALTGITHLDELTKNLKKLYDDENMSEEDFLNYINDASELNRSIHINLEKAASLVKSFKKVAVDQSSDESRMINMKQYVEDILLSLHNKIKQTNIKVNLDINPDIQIMTKPGAISQIITNLIVNSLIHAFEPKQNGNINISIKKENDNIVLTYKDNGKGIPLQIQDKIFNPFYTTNRANGGSGLGMSIVYNLVTNGLNGTITLQSNIDDGTQFDIIFPVIKG